jgi:type I restriction enzyme R subunit
LLLEFFLALADAVIVITDEAHRSQYDQLAANMRRALPKAFMALPAPL